MAGSIGKVEGTLGLRDEFTKVLTRASTQLAKSGAKLKQVGDQMTNVGSQLTKSITVPLTLAAGAALKFSIGFSDSLIKIETLVGVNREVVQGWRKDILDLGGETARAPKELADAMFFVTSAGQRGAEALHTLRVSAQAAAIGLGDTVVVADAVTSAMNAYGPSVLSASEATNILALAVRAGKLEASALAPVLGRLLPTASAIGISFKDVAGVLAVMSRTGVDAAEAATSLNSIMLTMLKPTTQAKEALQEVGLELSDLREVARGPGGVIAAMRLLQDKFDGNTDALTRVVPNIRAFSGVMNILAQNSEVVDQVMADVASGVDVLGEGMRRLSDDAGFKFRQFLSEAQRTLIELGDTLTPAFRILLNVGTSLLSMVSKGIERFSRLPTPVKSTTVALLSLAAVAGPLLLTFGGLVKTVGVLAIAFPGFTAGIVTATTAVKGLSIAVATNPLLIAGLAVAAGILALTAALEHFGTITTDVEGAVKDLRNELNNLGLKGEASIRRLTDNALPAFNRAFNEMRLAGKDMVEIQAEIGDEAGKLLSEFNRLGVSAPRIFVDMVNKMRAATSETKEVTDSVGDLEDALKDVKTKVEEVGEAFTLTVDAEEFVNVLAFLGEVKVFDEKSVSIFSAEIMQIVRNVKEIKRVGDDVVITVKKTAEESGKWRDSTDDIVRAIGRANSSLSETARIIQFLVSNWKDFEKTSQKVVGILGAAASLFNSFSNTRGPQTTTAFGGISEGDFGQEGAQLGAIIGAFFGVPAVGAALGELFGGLIKKGADEFLAVITDIKGRIITTLGTFSGALQEIGQVLTKGIVDGINLIIDELGGTLIALPDIAVKIRGDLVTVFVNGIEKSFDNINDAMQFAAQEALRTATISGLSPEIQKLLKSSFGKSFEQFISEIGLVLSDLELQLDPFTLELRNAFKPFETLRLELERLGIAADGANRAILRTAEGFRDNILGITKDAFERMVEQAAIFNAEMQRLGLDLRITTQDLAEARKRLDAQGIQKRRSAGASRRQAREAFEDTLNDIINNSLDAVQGLLADHTDQLADLEEQRKKTKVSVDLFNKAVSALNEQLADSLRNLGESIAANLSPIAAMVFRMQDVQDNIALLRDNFIEFGFSIEQVDNIIRDFGENEFLRIATGLAQFIDDEELIRELENLRAVLTIANYEFQIQLLEAMGDASGLTGEQFDRLREILGRARDAIRDFNREMGSLPTTITGVAGVGDDEELPEDVRKLGESIASTLSPLAALFFRMRDLRDNIGLLQRRFQEFGFSAVALRLILRNFGQTQFLEIASGLAQFINDEELKRDLERLRATLTIANFELQIEMLESMGAASGLLASELERLREILGQAKDAINDSIDGGLDPTGPTIAEQIQSILDEARTFLSSGIQLPSQRLKELNDKFRDLAAQLVALGSNVDSALAELNTVFEQVIDAFIMSLIDPLRDLLRELLGDISGSTESFQTLQQQFKDIAGLALGGDIDAIAELPDAIRAFRDSIVARFGANSVEAKLFNEQFRQILEQLIAAGVNIDPLTGDGGGGASFGPVTGNQMIAHSDRQFTLLEEIRDGINTLNEDHEFAA